jgi:hypothetical protein
MIEITHIILAALIFLAAILYSSVGHAGASGYLAVMALMGISPLLMKPSALTLNILVASIAIVKFYRAGAFSWRLFLPLTLASAPFAYLGGYLSLPGHIYKPIVGVVLIYAAWRSFQTSKQLPTIPPRTAPVIVLIICGIALGFLSGLTGVGGGIFLSPLLLFFRWAETKVISGVSAAFILINSIFGLLGVMTTSTALPEALPYWMVAAALGGLIGAELGSKRLHDGGIRKVLAVVLVIAGIKMVLTV